METIIKEESLAQALKIAANDPSFVKLMAANLSIALSGTTALESVGRKLVKKHVLFQEHQTDQTTWLSTSTILANIEAFYEEGLQINVYKFGRELARLAPKKKMMNGINHYAVVAVVKNEKKAAKIRKKNLKSYNTLKQIHKEREERMKKEAKKQE